MTAQLLRDHHIQIGILPTGKHNAITDVPGVRVGHFTLIEGKNIRTGATAILPHGDNIFQQKIPAAIYVGNGFGKLAGYSQVKELGTLETPILLTNTLNVATGIDALIDYTFGFEANANVRSVNAVVGETNDGYLNDIRGRHLNRAHMLAAIRNAKSGKIAQGNVGAGTGTVCFGFKGGIGSASRKLPDLFGGYTIGVLVQTNFGGVLQIDGVPIGKELGQYYFKRQIDAQDADGSCMIVVATDAPINARNLERIAKRAIMGLAKTGSIASNGSGDYVIAFSTHPDLREAYEAPNRFLEQKVLRNDAMSPLFMATIEATEEAILNSLFAAKTLSGNGRTIEALPIKKVIEIMKQYNRIQP
ncbi:MAG: P1 family peptidase [Bacteroidota bacterium]